MRMEPDWDLVSSELESHGELGSDQEGVHGRRDHAPEQRWLLGQLCLSACPLSTCWAQRGRGVQPLPLQLTQFPSWEQGPHISSTFQGRWKSGEVSGSNIV